MAIENANLGAAERAKIDAIARLTEQSIGFGHAARRSSQGYPVPFDAGHSSEVLPQLIPTEPHNERALLSHMLQVAQQLLRSSCVTLVLSTQEGQIQNPISAHEAEEPGRLRQLHDQLRQRLPHLHAMMAGGQPLYLNQQSESAYRDLLPDGSCLVALLPLLVHGQLLGVLHSVYRHQTSELREQQVIELFARQIAIVIFTSRLIRSDERRQLERNLHDTAKTGVRTMMLYIKLAHDALQRNCTEAKQHLHEARRQGWVVLSDISLVLNDLSEIDTDTLTLKELIQKHLPVLGGQTSEKVDLQIAERLPSLPLTVTRALLFIIREAVVNAREHGGATQVRVEISADRLTHRLRLLIDDNGSGFDPQKIRLSQINVMNVEQSMVEQLLDAATLTIVTAQRQKIRYYWLTPVKQLRRAIG